MNNNDEQIMKLKQKLDNLADRDEIVHYKITEQFTRNNTYNLTNLKAETEAGFIMFYDAEGVLLENDNYVLNGFLIDSLKEHGIHITDHHIEIKFNCGGHIKIEY